MTTNRRDIIAQAVRPRRIRVKKGRARSERAETLHYLWEGGAFSSRLLEKRGAAIGNEEHRQWSRETDRTGEVQSKVLQLPTKGTYSMQPSAQVSLHYFVKVWK